MSIARARSLRRQMPPAEARLWNALRTADLKPWHFRRQVSIGPYYADFASLGAKLVIEVDGSGHFSNEAGAYDARRDAFLRAKGYRVLRVTTSDVLNHLDGVYAAIRGAVANIDRSRALRRLALPTHRLRRSPLPPFRRGGSAD